MKLREALEEINRVLSENFAKPIIKIGHNNYDEENGRKVITECGLRGMVYQQFNTDESIGVDRQYTMNWCGISFTLKKKKSGINGYNYCNQYTYIAMIINEDCQQYLDFETTEIEKIYKDKLLAEETRKQREKENKRKKFYNKLEELGLTLEQFFEAKSLYLNLDFDEKNRIRDVICKNK